MYFWSISLRCGVSFFCSLVSVFVGRSSSRMCFNVDSQTFATTRLVSLSSCRSRTHWYKITLISGGTAVGVKHIPVEPPRRQPCNKEDSVNPVLKRLQSTHCWSSSLLRSRSGVVCNHGVNHGKRVDVDAAVAAVCCPRMRQAFRYAVIHLDVCWM